MSHRHPSTYEHHYGVGLLDDLHNYFPDILYGPSRFETVQDLLRYMRDQTRNQFDRFSSGMQRYGGGGGHGGLRRHAPPPQPQPQPQPPLRQRATPVQRRVVASSDLFNLLTPSHLSTPLMDPLADMLSSLLNVNNAVHPNPHIMEPVIVRPSAAQIAAATMLDAVQPGDDARCAICQEDLEVGTSVRTLMACNHGFHPTCIDRWFQQNVRCPVCRHDIRDGTPTTAHSDSSDDSRANPVLLSRPQT